MASLQVQTPPLNEPVSLVTLKNHLRVTIDADDALIELYLQAARELIEGESGRSLVNKAYRQSHDRFPRIQDWRAGSGFSYLAPRYANRYADTRQAIKLLRAPLVSVSKITYVDTAGIVQTLLPAPEAWQPDTEYVVGDVVVDPNGNLQKVTEASESETGGTSSSEESAPAWSDTEGVSTPDGELVWVNQGTAPAGDFLVDRESEPPRLMPLFSQYWPATLRVPNAVQVYFTAGYGDDGAAAPATLKVAVMMAVGVSYEFREAVTATLLRELDWYNRLIYSERVTDFNPTK
jgi:hypothetical protein